MHAAWYLRPAPKTHRRPTLRRCVRALLIYMRRLLCTPHIRFVSLSSIRGDKTREVVGWFHGRRHHIQLRPATDARSSRPIPAHRSANTPSGTMATAHTLLTCLNDLAQLAAAVLRRDDRDFAHLRAPAPPTPLPDTALRLAHCTHPELASGTLSTRPLAICADDIGFSYAPLRNAYISPSGARIGLRVCVPPRGSVPRHPRSCRGGTTADTVWT